jgi:ribosome biogenesis GTPase
MNKENLIRGLVTRSTGSWYDVLDSDGNKIKCRLKGKYKIAGIKSTNPIAVGDKVKYTAVREENTGLIVHVEPRKNFIHRKATKLSKQTHIIASNIDTAFLIVTHNRPRTSLGFIDRFLVAAEANLIPIILVFNKYDLLNTDEKASIHLKINTYKNIGYTCLQTSAKTLFGIEELAAHISNKTIVFGGHSGVGKSALINAIEPGLNLKTAQISTYYEKGKHTTTFAEMHKLSSGGYLIDTPGIKEFGMLIKDTLNLSSYFPEMKQLAVRCRFHNCLHHKEPDCAVKESLSKGEIAQSRYSSYLAMLEELINNQKH